MKPIENPIYYVSRQVNTYDGTYYVEIASGGQDYANPGQLCRGYPGEAEEYYDPREAVDVALKIFEKWSQDVRDIVIEGVYHGHTGGYTMFFNDGEPETPEEIRAWAQKRYETAEKCGVCEAILGKEQYYLNDWDGILYCSEYCVDKEARFQQEQDEESEDE